MSVVRRYIMFAMAEHGTRGCYRNGCRQDECVAANREYQRKWYEANRDEALERSRKHYGATRDQQLEYGRKRYEANRDKLLDGMRKRYEANRDEVIANALAWAQTNPDRARENKRRWAEANPDKRRESGRKKARTRRARKLDTFVEHVDPQVVFERDSWTCHICDEAINPGLRHPDPMSASLDHIIPLAKGGEHSYANSGTSHLRCNQRKHTKVA
jgi:5-methylcytosine-specific restriction endonuclease McrA